jgi:hypothetical protein
MLRAGLVVSAFALSACLTFDRVPTTAACVEHTQAACTCAEGGSGMAVCNARGDYDACVCLHQTNGQCDRGFADVDGTSANGCETRTPLAIDAAHLALWLRAEDYQGGTWKDASGNHHDAHCSTCPVAGHKLTFDGTQAFDLSGTFTGFDGLSWAVALGTDSPPVTTSMLELAQAASNDNQARITLAIIAGPNLVYQVCQPEQVCPYAISPLLPSGTTRLVGTHQSDGQVTMRIDGQIAAVSYAEQVAGQSGVALPQPAGRTSNRIASSGVDGLGNFAGQLDELVLYDHALTADDQDALVTYLERRWH